ncbi:hypothetical protein AJ80_03290 [Polytolypa hystricis UAMH7299]|uniref:Glucosidase 2 subunit beta n=1 Tax=Polytolypa hystricis (strain UAMH7299) TaxID=1447883 RepID=A0A2B7YK43_POLH7|nr:hypothetical protein AJ80_03290 [Polytolypa hystricis UAMH7299]
MKRPNELVALLGILACSTVCAAGSDGSSRPRGVGPEFAKYYKDTSTFACISNPSIKIPFSSVNDDYCDCPDGSDEPGTAACSHISASSITSDFGDGVNRTPALPGFYCVNKGHNPSYISFQRVNDGACDYDICCDGSDEWARVGGTKCDNRCKEIGKEWRKQEEQRQKSMTAATRKRKELAETASRLRKEVEDRIENLEVERQASELKIQGLKVELEEVRARERGKVVKGQKQGKVNVLAGLAKERVEELRTILLEVRQQRDESVVRAAELEAILSKFKEEYNPNFNDEGVKRAVRSWEEYAARETTGGGSNAASDRDLDEICKPDGEDSGINWEQWENEIEGETELDLIYKIAAYFPPSLVNFIEDKLSDFRKLLVENGIVADTASESGESKAVIDARNRLSSAESSLNDVTSQLSDHRSDLVKDYGHDEIFRSMKGSCVSRDSGEYTYELCWMEKTKQKSKKGGMHTTMGNFVRFSSVTVDEFDASGKLVPQEKLALEYENGQSCWNGPARSTKVILQCGENDEILKVAEDEKCMYSMHVTSPAACDIPINNGKGATGRKDEL